MGVEMKMIGTLLLLTMLGSCGTGGSMGVVSGSGTVEYRNTIEFVGYAVTTMKGSFDVTSLVDDDQLAEGNMIEFVGRVDSDALTPAGVPQQLQFIDLRIVGDSADFDV